MRTFQFGCRKFDFAPGFITQICFLKNETLCYHVAQRRKKGGAASSDPSSKQATPAPRAPTSKWAKAIRPGAEWTKETFPEFPDVRTIPSLKFAIIS